MFFIHTIKDPKSPYSAIMVINQHVTLFLKDGLPKSFSDDFKKVGGHYVRIDAYLESDRFFNCFDLTKRDFHSNPLIPRYAPRIIMGLKEKLSNPSLCALLDELELASDKAEIVALYEKEIKRAAEDIYVVFEWQSKRIDQYNFEFQSGSQRALDKELRAILNSPDMIGLRRCYAGNLNNKTLDLIKNLRANQHYMTVLDKLILEVPYFAEPFSVFLSQLEQTLHPAGQKPKPITFHWDPYHGEERPIGILPSYWTLEVATGYQNRDQQLRAKLK